MRHGEHSERVRQRDAAKDQRPDDVGDDHHAAPVPAVGERPGDQAEQQVRQCLEGDDQCGDERRPGELVRQHRQGDVGDRRAGQRHHASTPVAAEVGVVPQATGADHRPLVAAHGEHSSGAG